jgi:hypothetical protein
VFFHGLLSVVGGRGPVVVNTSWIDHVMRSCGKQFAHTLHLLRLEQLANRLRLVLSTLYMLFRSFCFLWPFGVMPTNNFVGMAELSSSLLDAVNNYLQKVKNKTLKGFC